LSADGASRNHQLTAAGGQLQAAAADFGLSMRQLARDNLPLRIQLLPFFVTGLFSVCSQLWRGKIPKVFPLLSVSSQLWQIVGERTECQPRIAARCIFGGRHPHHPP
jgi:hypothetical protein